MPTQTETHVETPATKKLTPNKQIKVLFLRQVKDPPIYLSTSDKLVFKEEAEKVSATLEDISFTEGGRLFTFPASFSRVAREAIQWWCEAEGWQVVSRPIGNGVFEVTISHP